MPREEALELGRTQEKDLIEIVPKGEIPVAKLTEYGKFRYQKEKEFKKQKSQQKKVDVKGIRLSLRIGKHDVDLRVRQAIEFLADGDKVRPELMLKGREKAHPELGYDVIKNFVKEVGLQTPIKIELTPGYQSGKIFAIIAPNK